MSGEERELLTVFRQLNPNDQVAILEQMRQWAAMYRGVRKQSAKKRAAEIVKGLNTGK